MPIYITLTLHLLAAVIWVGGMFFAYMALRPAALALEPPQRLPLWSRTFAHFFPWVWVSIITLLVTGYLMLFFTFGGFAQAGTYIHIMHATGLIMVLIFLHVFFAPYRRLKQALAASDFPTAGKYLAQIRVLIGINTIIGVITIIVASSGPFWSLLFAG